MRSSAGQESTDAVAGLRCLYGKSVIEATEHGESGDLFVSQLQR